MNADPDPDPVRIQANKITKLIKPSASIIIKSREKNLLKALLLDLDLNIIAKEKISQNVG